MILWPWVLPSAFSHTPPLLPATSTTLQTLCTVQLLWLHHGKCDYLSGGRLLGSTAIDSRIMVLLSFTYFPAFSDWLFLVIAPMDLFQNQYNICSSAEINGKEHPLSLLWIMKQQGKDLVYNISKYIAGMDRKKLNTCDSVNCPNSIKEFFLSIWRLIFFLVLFGKKKSCRGCKLSIASICRT